MSRWIIIAGLATVLISLVGLATLAGSNQNTTEGASQVQESAEPDPSEAPEPEAPEPEAPNPSTTPDPAPEPVPEATTEEEGAVPEETNEGGGLLQGVQPDDQGGTGATPRIATIEITGDSRYSCSIGQIDSPRTIRGSNAAPFQVRVAPGGTSLDAVMAVCQKISGDNLGVSIVYDGEVRAQDSTMEQFGTISASWSPIQQ